MKNVVVLNEIIYVERGLLIKIKIYKVSSLNSIKYFNRKIIFNKLKSRIKFL